MSLSADPRLAVDFAIAEAFKRMAPDNYRPMPDKPEAATHTPTSRGLEGPAKELEQ